MIKKYDRKIVYNLNILKKIHNGNFNTLEQILELAHREMSISYKYIVMHNLFLLELTSSYLLPF